MRILHVVTRADVGGAQTYVLELATAQMQAGHVVGIAAGSLGQMADEAGRRGLTVLHQPALRRRIALRAEVRAWRGLLDHLDTFAPDVVHAHSSKAGVLARAAARRRRVPAVYTAHGWPFQPGAPRAQRVVSWAGEAMASRWWGHVICLTDAEALRARRVVPRGRLRVVPNALPDVEPNLRADLRAAAADGTVRLVMVARFAPPKHQIGVVEALAMLAPGRWQMDFVGDGPDMQRAVDTCARLGLDGPVRFLGERDDVPALLAASDVAVLWSRYEGMPLALMEAMRAGLACVADDLPGTRALLADGSCGVLVPFRTEALAGALQSLIDEPVRRRELGRAARVHFELECSMDVHLRRVGAVYDAAISEPRGRRATR